LAQKLSQSYIHRETVTVTVHDMLPLTTTLYTIASNTSIIKYEYSSAIGDFT